MDVRPTENGVKSIGTPAVLNYSQHTIKFAMGYLTTTMFTI